MVQTAVQTSIVEAPLVQLGRAVCGDLDAACRREWLVTNGLGGYASGTLGGIITRRYHGLLVASLAPPVARTVLVGGAVEWATYQGQRFPLCAHQWVGGTVDPHGYVNLESFALEGMLPVWTFGLAEALLERRLWMAHGANTTYVTYRLLRGQAPVQLEVTPLVTYRDFHSLSHGQGWQIGVEPVHGGVQIHAFDGAVPFRLLADGGTVAQTSTWYWNFWHRAETARGLDDRSDLFAPATFHFDLAPGGQAMLVYTCEQTIDGDGTRTLAAAYGRQRALLQRASASAAPPPIQQLVLAADQFIVERRPQAAPTGTEAGSATDASTATPPSQPVAQAIPAAPPAASETVIAGYHWFNDWGRDTMISLPGLALATGRAADAANILRAFARYVVDGLLPNNFPDQPGVEPGYNTADATLWYVLAIRACHAATGDRALVEDLLPVLRDIIEWHIRGTRYGIGMDAADALLHAGAPGLQLTWMDAKVGDWVVTPRMGKPVEINALWYNALRSVADFLAPTDLAAAGRYSALAARTGASFRQRFCRAEGGGLADVVDGPQGDDWSCRPNQIFALSLPHALLDGAAAVDVLDAVGRWLYSSYGLRSLSPSDAAYTGTYGGDGRARDGAYHQGTVWTWLLGPYIEAHHRVHGDADAALALLRPLASHLLDAGLGTVSEIMEGDAPFLPRGAIAQAWSVGEWLRVWRTLTRE